MCIRRNSLSISGQFWATFTMKATDFLFPSQISSSLSYPLCTQYLMTCLVNSSFYIPTQHKQRNVRTNQFAVHSKSSSEVLKSSKILLNNFLCLYTFTFLRDESNSAIWPLLRLCHRFIDISFSSKMAHLLKNSQEPKLDALKVVMMLMSEDWFRPFSSFGLDNSICSSNFFINLNE